MADSTDEFVDVNVAKTRSSRYDSDTLTNESRLTVHICNPVRCLEENSLFLSSDAFESTQVLCRVLSLLMSDVCQMTHGQQTTHF